MAAKKKSQPTREMAAVQLKSFKGFVNGNEAFEFQASVYRKMYMIPALKVVYVEATNPVSNVVTVSRVNMDNFLICEFVQIEDDTSAITINKPEPVFVPGSEEEAVAFGRDE